MNMGNIYVAYFVIVYEDIWFEWESDVIKRKETSYGLQGQMFIGSDLESAYEIAKGMVGGMDDAHHDGEGDLFKMYSTGINSLEEITSFNSDFTDQLNDAYGIDCGVIIIESAFSKEMKPKVKSKDELLER